VFVLVLIKAVARVVVQLPTNIAVAVQLLSVGVGRLEAVLVGVVHSLPSFFDELVQFVLNESGQVEVVFLHPLLLIFPNSDVLAGYHTSIIHIILHKDGELGCQPCYCMDDGDADGAVSPPYSLPLVAP
jgi:hypothetical protein